MLVTNGDVDSSWFSKYCVVVKGVEPWFGIEQRVANVVIVLKRWAK